MTKQEKQLRVLAKSLQDADSNVDSYYDGALETAVKYGVQSCMQRIGDYLEEVLNMSDEQLNN